ncbi:MAG: general secretion pathway protein L [Moritella sp.]|jgi:general secretion pathway protein L
MSEQLVVRLGSESWQAIHWLVWSTTENEIIASGILANAAELAELQIRAGGRAIITLVPSCDITFKQVELPARGNKQVLNALPYMLEQELSSDVEKLHFALLDKKGNTVSVAIIAHEKMKLWQSWLVQAELNCEQFIPDVLTLPLAADSWSAIQFDGQWLIRQSKVQGICIEAELLSIVLAVNIDPAFDKNNEDSDQRNTVISYSEIPNHERDNWQQANIELPMKLCAEGAVTSSCNLLQGSYNIELVANPNLKLWRRTAVAASLALMMVFTYQFVELNQLKQEQVRLESDIKQVYQTVFKPKKMRLNTRLVKKQMQNRLAELQRGGNSSGFLAMLSQLTPDFKQSPGIQPISIRFDAKQGTLRVQASATNFQVFNKLKTTIATRFDVTQGTLSQKQGKVQGTLDIRGKE